MLRREDRRRGHHYEFNVGDGHARPLCLFLGILHHDDVLGDAIRLHIVLVHVGAEGDHVDGVEPSTVGVEEGNDVECRHLCVEGVGVLEVVVPDLIDDVVEKFGRSAFCRFEACVVIEAGFVGRLRSYTNDCGGVVRDAAVVEWEAGGGFERVTAMVGGVPHTIHDDGREGVDSPQKIVGDLHEDRE